MSEANSKIFARWQEVPGDLWPCRHFIPREIACRDGSILLHFGALKALDSLRDDWGWPLVVNSGYRSPDYNEKLRKAGKGAAKASKHLTGTAFDISTAGWSVDQKNRFLALAYLNGFRGFGFYDSFIHIDLGPGRHWDQRRATRAERLINPLTSPPVEPVKREPDPEAFTPVDMDSLPPVPTERRERLGQSRSMKGAGVAGLSGVAATALAVLQDAWSWASDNAALIGCGLGAAVIIGAGVVIWARMDDWKKGWR